MMYAGIYIWHSRYTTAKTFPAYMIDTSKYIISWKACIGEMVHGNLMRHPIPSAQLVSYWYIYKVPFLSRRAIPLPSRIDIHLLARGNILAAQVVHGDVLADLLLPDDLLVQHGRRAPLENVALLLLAALVRLHEAPL